MSRILVVDDEKGMRNFLGILLRQAGHDVIECGDGIEAISQIKNTGFDLIITDLKLPGVNGMEILKTARMFIPNVQVIMITAFATTENAVEAMKLGAYHYFIKPFKPEEIKVQVEKALEKSRLIQENATLRERLNMSYRLEDIVGKSSAIKNVFEMIERVATVKSNVLITGESGTGKELVARAIHGKSPRAGEPFVVVNCSAIPDTLLESELFGYKKGSFTGALMDKEGLFETASGGTLFLDEVADIPTHLQVKLLRVLQDRTFKKIGGLNDITVDVRILAATNRDLETEMRAGRFREDLFYRLKVVEIHLPPLRDRREDIPILAQHFLRNYSAEQGKDINGFTPEVIKSLMNHNYRGNVRQLENIIERAVTLTNSGGKIEISSIGEITLETERLSEPVNFDDMVAKFEIGLIEKALKNNNGDLQKTSEQLGITTRSLRYRVSKYDINPH